MSESFASAAALVGARIAADARLFYERGWLMGTAGNFSVALSRAPLRLLITRSGLDKGDLGSDSFLVIDGDGDVLAGSGRSSDETALHLAIVAATGAGAIYHTHSMWSTLLTWDAVRNIHLGPHEMLKGLHGVGSHEHEESLPVIENSQDYVALAAEVTATLRAGAGSLHGILLRRHGLYTWGDTPVDAKRHVEILEFLLEATGRAAERGARIVRHRES